MDVFQKCFDFRDADIVRELGVYLYFRMIASGQDPVVTMNGQRVIMLGSNNYLGLTNHPEVKEAAARALESYGTGTAPDARLTAAVREVFNLTPRGIIEALDLRKPVFRRTAAYGHFGREEAGFTWEVTDRVEALRTALGS